MRVAVVVLGTASATVARLLADRVDHLLGDAVATEPTLRRPWRRTPRPGSGTCGGTSGGRG